MARVGNLLVTCHNQIIFIKDDTKYEYLNNGQWKFKTKIENIKIYFVSYIQKLINVN